MLRFLLPGLVVSALLFSTVTASAQAGADERLTPYRAELDAFRKKYGGARALPDDNKDSYTPGKDHDDRGAYPYLGWACDHFHGTKKSPIGNRDYPLTWEQRASQANYDGLKVLDPIYVQQKLPAPHTWHAAEYLLSSGKAPVPPAR